MDKPNLIGNKSRQLTRKVYVWLLLFWRECVFVRFEKKKILSIIHASMALSNPQSAHFSDQTFCERLAYTISIAKKIHHASGKIRKSCPFYKRTPPHSLPSPSYPFLPYLSALPPLSSPFLALASSVTHPLYLPAAHSTKKLNYHATEY